MPKLTPREAREKHARNLKNAIPDIKTGVARVTVAPTAKAADKIDKMRQGLLDAIDSGKTERALRAVTLEEWKAAMIDKGTRNIGPGVDAAASKIEAFFSQLFPYQESLQSRIAVMDDLTKEDSRARMNEWFDGMVRFQKS